MVVAQALLAKITRLQLANGCVRVIPPLSSPVLPICYTTIRNMPPLAFGIHNEQYDYNMWVIIFGL